MERVRQNDEWTFLDAAHATELEELWGGRLTARYVCLEATMSEATRVPARDVWQAINDAEVNGHRIKCVFWCAMNGKCICDLLAHPEVLTFP